MTSDNPVLRRWLLGADRIHSNLAASVSRAIKAGLHDDVDSRAEISGQVVRCGIEINVITLVVARVCKNQQAATKVDVVDPSREYEDCSGRGENRNLPHHRKLTATRTKRQRNESAWTQFIRPGTAFAMHDYGITG